MAALLGLVNSAISLALVVAFFWALSTLADLRRGQVQLQEEIDRIIEALGLPSRRARAAVRCEHCGAVYLDTLPECYRCKRPRPANAVRIMPGAAPQETTHASGSERGG
jgi:hypothetical protein